jgi:hypothetical protein
VDGLPLSCVKDWVQIFQELVLIDWIITEPPQRFLEFLEGMQDPDKWHETIEAIFLGKAYMLRPEC